MAMTLLHRAKAATPAPAPATDPDEPTEQTELEEPAEPTAGCIPIAEVSWRHTARFLGRVRSLRVQPWAGVATLECTLVDDTGGVTVVFLGRRRVPGVGLGRRMVVEGMAGEHHGKLALLNPEYTLLAAD